VASVTASDIKICGFRRSQLVCYLKSRMGLEIGKKKKVFGKCLGGKKVSVFSYRGIKYETMINPVSCPLYLSFKLVLWVKSSHF